jgi:hypothetical protein
MNRGNRSVGKVTAYVMDKSGATSGGRGAPRQDRIWDSRSLLAS